jgi:hypothetical protein
MRQDIIDMMRSELYDDKFCQNDFEKYDLESINKFDEPFLWLVRPSGTHIAHIGPTAMREFENNKSCRFAWYRDEFAPIMSVVYWNNMPDLKYFFYDGIYLLRIKAEEVKEIFRERGSHRDYKYARAEQMLQQAKAAHEEFLVNRILENSDEPADMGENE